MKMIAPRVHFGPPGNPKVDQKSTFGVQIGALGAKNALQKGVVNKNMKISKTRSRNDRFVEAKNLPKCCKGHQFQGFRSLRTNRQINPKMAPKMIPKSGPFWLPNMTDLASKQALGGQTLARGKMKKHMVEQLLVNKRIF